MFNLLFLTKINFIKINFFSPHNKKDKHMLKEMRLLKNKNKNKKGGCVSKNWRA